MKKKRARAALAIAVLLAAAWLWYTRPMTLERLCPGIDLSECRRISGYYQLPGDAGLSGFDLTPEDPGFAPLLAQFQGRTFRRSVRGLLSRSGGAHAGLSPKDTRWDAYLDFDAVSLPGGGTVSGSLLWFDNFFGTVDIGFAGRSWRQVSTPDKARWVSDIQALLSAP